jgi:hypothetical protein
LPSHNFPAAKRPSAPWRISLRKNGFYNSRFDHHSALFSRCPALAGASRLSHGRRYKWGEVEEASIPMSTINIFFFGLTFLCIKNILHKNYEVLFPASSNGKKKN